MKKNVQLKESDLIRLVEKIVKEQESMEDPSEDYFKIIDIVANHAVEEQGDFDEVERCVTEIYKIMHDANSDEELSEEQADEIVNYGSDVIKQLEGMFDLEESKNVFKEQMDVSSDSEYYQQRKREVSIPFDDLAMLGGFATEFCRDKENLPDCRDVRRLVSRYNLFM